jgi:selenium metabolism protein YedF
MTLIDALGMPCPIPVVKAKKALQELPETGGQVQILVDNTIACENLAKMAMGLGYTYALEPQAEQRFAVTLTSGGGSAIADEPCCVPAVSSGEGLVVSIGQNTMGKGSDELGAILIKGFVFSLTQLSPPPAAVLLFNSGVHLAVEGANTAEDLQMLADLGARIRICGTCADYYNVKDALAVGEVTNMYGIVEELAAAARVINL